MAGLSNGVSRDMAVTSEFFTRFTIFLWCGIGFLLVSLYHILMSGYNMRAGFMLLLSLALLAAAFTERKKRQIRAWQEEQARKSKDEILKKNR
jgi:membrane protein implicated in regulation of membrane protease activity